MPIESISNGEAGSNVRTKLNSTISAVNGLGGAANLNVGAITGTVCAGDDSRLADARPPTAHASTHVTGGPDAIQVATAEQPGLATAAQITKLDGIEAGADVTDATNVGAAIHGSTEKTTPANADEVGLIDSAAANVLKWVSWTNIKATLKSYFDTLYALASHTHALSALTQSDATSSQVPQWNGAAWVPVTLASGGDMTKAVYDSQNLGKISGASGLDTGGTVGAGGHLSFDGGASGVGGIGGAAGSIDLDGGFGDSFEEAPLQGGNAGSITMRGGGAQGGYNGGHAGNINTSGGVNINGGDIDTTAGGDITSGQGDVDLGNTSGTLQPHALSTIGNASQQAETTVASAATCSVGGAASDNVLITGGTNISSLGTVAAGIRRHCRFAGALNLIHHATSLILPGGANILTAENDSMLCLSLGSGNWKVLGYWKQDGTSVVGGSGNWTLISTTTISGSPATVDVSLSGSCRKYMIELEDVYGTSDGYVLTMRTSSNGGGLFDSGASDYAAALSGIGYYADSRAIASSCALTNAVHSTANKGVNGQIVFYDPLNSSLKTNWAGTLLCMEYGSAHIKGFDILGRRDTAAAVDAVRFYFSVGNMGGGKIRVFGWNE